VVNERGITLWEENEILTDEEWESAYRKFETPQQEIKKFKARLKRLGADNWQKDARIVELFCGRCNGLKALEELGFSSLEGVDMSLSLLREYSGNAQLYAGDCRDLRFETGSRDYVIVQGGLHHLPLLPDDLEGVFSDVKRILKPGGHFVFVEPWKTPFLDLVQWACSSSFFTSRWAKLKTLHDMIEGEKTTYYNWLDNKPTIDRLLRKYFVGEKRLIRFGKIFFTGVAE